VTNSANLDLVRSIYADWERGDFSSVQWADPEIEYVFTDGPAPGSWKGLAGMARANRDWLSAWEDWHAGAEEYRDLDDERVLVLTRRGGRGKTSGFEIERIQSKGAAVWHVRDDQVTRLVIYWDRDRALADLGLEGTAMSEESTTPDLEELLQRVSDALGRRDLDVVMKTYAPNAVFESVGMGVYEGHAAIRAFVEDWIGAFEDYGLEPQGFRDLGRGVTLFVAVQRGRLPGSKGWLHVSYACVAIWADGLIERQLWYADIEQARAAAERLAQERG
jgi:ketosteroid isomerase-like protein